MDTIKYYSIRSVPSGLKGVKTRPDGPFLLVACVHKKTCLSHMHSTSPPPRVFTSPPFFIALPAGPRRAYVIYVPLSGESSLPSLRPILMQSDRWIENGDFRSKTKSCILTQSKKCLFDPIFFDRANPIRASRRKNRLFQRNGRIGLLDRKSF